jgi:hypothetical protein
MGQGRGHFVLFCVLQESTRDVYLTRLCTVLRELGVRLLQFKVTVIDTDPKYAKKLHKYRYVCDPNLAGSAL